MTDLITLPRATVQQALEAGDCSLWPGGLLQGYGIIWNFQSTGKRKKAHVAAWEQINGPVPEGRVLDHVCRKRSCVNPLHLDLVTPTVNTLRGNGPTAQNARKTHCNKGHPLEGENLMVDYRGRRKCKRCQRDHEMAYQRKTRGAKNGS